MFRFPAMSGEVTGTFTATFHPIILGSSVFSSADCTHLFCILGARDATMIFLCIFVTLLTVICVLHLRDSSSFPPGPPRYPIIGSLIFLPWILQGARIYLLSASIANKYGKVMGFFFGPKVKLVLVNDFETAKQMANDENFYYRKVNYVATHFRGNGENHIGVVNTSGERWRRNRRFSLTTLKGE